MESKIQTVYDHNARLRTIKVYVGIAMLAFAREPSAKAKKCNNNVMARGGSEHATSHARGMRVSAKPIADCPYICGPNKNPVKQLSRSSYPPYSCP